MSKVALSREKTHWQVLRLIKPISFRLIFHRFWSAFLKTVIYIYVFLLTDSIVNLLKKNLKAWKLKISCLICHDQKPS